MTCDATIEDSRGQQRVCQLDTGHYPATRHKSVLRDGKEVMEWTDQAEFAKPSSDSAATVLSPAETLTAAAKLLRERATAAFHETDVPQGLGDPDFARAWRDGFTGGGPGGPTTGYAAMLTPGVGLALADWLEREAALWEAMETAKAELHPKGFKLSWGISTHREALAVARQLLGEAS